MHSYECIILRINAAVYVSTRVCGFKVWPLKIHACLHVQMLRSPDIHWGKKSLFFKSQSSIYGPTSTLKYQLPTQMFKTKSFNQPRLKNGVWYDFISLGIIKINIKLYQPMFSFSFHSQTKLILNINSRDDIKKYIYKRGGEFCISPPPSKNPTEIHVICQRTKDRQMVHFFNWWMTL